MKLFSDLTTQFFTTDNLDQSLVGMLQWGEM